MCYLENQFSGGRGEGGGGGGYFWGKMKEGFGLKNVRKGFQVFLIGEGGILFGLQCQISFSY